MKNTTGVSFLLVATLFAFILTPAFATVRYVVPGGTGDGSSWANGASLGSVLANVSNGDVVLLQQGVYSVSSAVTLTDVKLTMRGGYAAGDADDAPSGDKYSTVLSNDAGLDNVWARFDPETGVTELVMDGDSTMPVIRNGALNLPPDYRSRHDVYFPVEDKEGVPTVCNGSLQSFLTLAGVASVEMANFTVSGFGGFNGNSTGSFLYWITNPPSTAPLSSTSSLADIAFVGNAGANTLVCSPNPYNYVGLTVTGCEAVFSRIGRGSAFFIAHWGGGANYTGCRFESLMSDVYDRRSAIAIEQSGRSDAFVRNCAFTRLVHANRTVASTQTVVTSFAVSIGVVSKSAVDGCTFDSCWMENTSPQSLVRTSKYTNLTDCRFRSNVTKVTSTVANCLQVPGCFYFGGDAQAVVDNCLFASNEISFVSAAATEVYAAPVLVDKRVGLVSDSVFDNNRVTLDAPEAGIYARFARAILIFPGAVNSSARIDTLNCTFTGDVAGDDVVFPATRSYTTVAAALKTVHLHDIFWSSAKDYAYAGCVSDFTTPFGHMTVQRSIVKNGGTLAPTVQFLDCASDDPMLAYDEETGFCAPTVAVSGVRGLPKSWYIVALNKTTGDYLFSQGRESGTTNMFVSADNQKQNTTCLVSRNGNYSVTDAAVTLAKPDALGTARLDGDATAGAVQTVFPEGRIVTAQVAPVDAGYVTVGSQYAGEGGFVAVTAVSSNPLYSFQKWVDEDGNTLSTSATYTPTTEADYTRIRAVFGAPQAKWTFRVDPEKGTFANGETEIVMTLNPGDDAPAYPEVTVNPAWHQTGWDKVMPAVVGSADLEFNVAFIPYTKVVYFDTHATGANDGTSWEDAYTHLGVAMENAGGDKSYVGEVRIRQGVHVLPNTQNPASRKFGNIRLIGGFTGNGAERSADRRLTVISGDTNGDDTYVDQHGEAVGKVYENGAFIEFRPPTAEEGWWEQANGSDNSAQAVVCDDTAVCTNARIECCTFSGFVSAQQKLITTGLSLNTVITNCDFIAINNAYSGAMGQIEMKAAGEVRDCRFLGITGAGLYLNAASPDGLFRLDDVKFLYSTRNRAKSRMIPFVNCNKGSVQAENLEVGHVTVCNYLDEGTATENKSASIVFMDSSGNAASKPCWIRNSYFHDISSPQNDRPTKLLTMEYCANAAILDNCVFENIEIGAEYKPAAANKNLDIIPIVAKTVTNCVFRNVSFAYTGAPEGAKYCALADIREGLYGTTFENCRLSSAMNMYSFLVMSRGITGQAFNAEYGEGTHFIDCSVTNTGTYASDGYGSVALLEARAVNMNSSSFRHVGPLEIRDCSVYAPSMASAFLVDDIGGVGGTVSGTVDGLSVLGCRVEGGTVAAGILRVGRAGAGAQPPAAVFRNVTVAENTLVSTVPSAAVVYRPTFNLNIGWSTFCGNVAPCEFYIVGNYKLNLTSSVVTSEADGWVAQKSSGNAQAANGIVFANSYVKGVDSSSPYFSGENAFTVEPLMTGVVRNRRQRCYGVYHAPQSPYARQAELAGVYSDEAAFDAAGVARPPEGPVLIGAMQTIYAAPGLMILVK